MNDILLLIPIAIIAIVGCTLAYKIVPFKTLGNIKPKFVFFPKYKADFNSSISNIETSLNKLGFVEIKKSEYSRGKFYGDFSTSIKYIKLSVKLNKEAKRFTVCASFLGILFDTGDIWQLATDILDG